MPTALFTTLCKESTLLTAWNAVRAKGSVGGVDGMCIDDFEKNKRLLIPQIAQSLRDKTWMPQPYLQIEVTKNKNPQETRKLGMTAVGDKIVQYAIKTLIEPRFEKMFLGCSYGFRPGRSPVKAIRRTLAESQNKKYQYVLRLDIDDFFDNIDHEILQKRLTTACPDLEIVRLVMLCVKMGQVTANSGKWQDVTKGVPQGAVLSPLLSNLYLNSFDQFALSNGVPFIRYADDFLYLCETEEQARQIQDKTIAYLTRLHLSLNTPYIILPLADGFDFLGVTIKGKGVNVLPTKLEELRQCILQLEITADGLSRKSGKTWEGLTNYYAQLLPQSDLELFDSTLLERLRAIILNQYQVFKRSSDIAYVMTNIGFLSKVYQIQCKGYITDLQHLYTECKNASKNQQAANLNKKIIQQRKAEFHRKEAAGAGLLVSKPGLFIGLTARGITVSKKGKVVSQQHAESVSQIVITGDGISLSSNLIAYCLANKIPIDFFDAHGHHQGSVMTAKYMENTLWREQSLSSIETRNEIALAIMEGKVKNQEALLKYFHKYHKHKVPSLATKLEAMNKAMDDFKTFKKNSKLDDDDFVTKVVAHEAQVAIKYWDYIRELLQDDGIAFDSRTHQGATDLFNCSLNYGYAILYARVWQALLAAKLNPFESLIHAKHEGNPTLVYDMIEIFRSQVVDRVVIRLIQKGQNMGVANGLLTDTTRRAIAKAVMERLARYEKFHGEEIKMEDILLKQTRLLAEAFKGNKKFKPYVAKW